MSINLNGVSRDAAKQLAAAFASEDTEQIEEGFAALQSAIAEDVAEQYREAIAANDAAVLAARGFRQLTGEETKFYQGLIGALKSDNPRQAFATLPDKVLPTTVIEDVMRNIATGHPLLGLIRITTTGAVTRFVRNKHGQSMAAWGELTSAIVEEITSKIDVIDLKQGKLSAFVVLSRDMLELGPTFLDAYIRAVLTEAVACGLENGVVTGKGIKGEPIGLARDIHEGVSVNSSTGYPAKTPVAVTSFEPKAYGDIVAKLVKNEQGNEKGSGALASLALVCNSTDYLTKIMPATTTVANGVYVGNLFPVPTQVVESSAVESGKAILMLASEYDLFVGSNRGIEYSDENKFIEDQRVFKFVTHANGVAYDNTSAIVLDISKLEPAYLNVTVKGEVKTKA